MDSVINFKEFDDILPEKLIYETINDVNIRFPLSRFDEYCYVSHKLREIEINLKISTEVAADDIVGCMKRSAKYHNVDFDKTDVPKLYKMMCEDCRSYATKYVQFTQNDHNSGYWKWCATKTANVIHEITIQYNKILKKIDSTITELSTTIKSVEVDEQQLNKVNYNDVLGFDHYHNYSEEQNKLLKEGKDIFSKEMILLDIKQLRTFKSRVLRIYNKYFGKDSYFGPLNLQDACK